MFVPLLVNRGNNSSVLHYGHAGAANDKTIMDGDMWSVSASRFASTHWDSAEPTCRLVVASACSTWVENITATPRTSPAPTQPTASSAQTRGPFTRPCSSPPALSWLPSGQVCPVYLNNILYPLRVDGVDSVFVGSVWFSRRAAMDFSIK